MFDERSPPSQEIVAREILDHGAVLIFVARQPLENEGRRHPETGPANPDKTQLSRAKSFPISLRTEATVCDVL